MIFLFTMIISFIRIANDTHLHINGPFPFCNAGQLRALFSKYGFLISTSAHSQRKFTMKTKTSFPDSVDVVLKPIQCYLYDYWNDGIMAFNEQIKKRSIHTENIK